MIIADLEFAKRYREQAHYYRRWKNFLVFTNMATLVLVAILAMEAFK